MEKWRIIYAAAVRKVKRAHNSKISGSRTGDICSLTTTSKDYANALDVALEKDDKDTMCTACHNDDIPHSKRDTFVCDDATTTCRERVYTRGKA